MDTNTQNAFLTAHDWWVLGAFVLLLIGLSFIDARAVPYVGIGAIVIMVAQHV